MKDNGSVHESLVLIMQFGINMIVPILLCTWFGVWLSDKTGHGFLVVALFFVGAAAGVQNCYRLTKRMIAREQQRKGSREIAMEEAAKAGKCKEAQRADGEKQTDRQKAGNQTGRE